MMPGYTMPPYLFYLLSPVSLFSSHSFFSPFPTHFMFFLPNSWTSLHFIFSSNLIESVKQILIFNGLGNKSCYSKEKINK